MEAERTEDFGSYCDISLFMIKYRGGQYRMLDMTIVYRSHKEVKINIEFVSSVVLL